MLYICIISHPSFSSPRRYPLASLPYRLATPSLQNVVGSKSQPMDHLSRRNRACLPRTYSSIKMARRHFGHWCLHQTQKRHTNINFLAPWSRIRTRICQNEALAIAQLSPRFFQGKSEANREKCQKERKRNKSQRLFFHQPFAKLVIYRIFVALVYSWVLNTWSACPIFLPDC